MIRSKKELKFYLRADRMMNCGEFEPSLVTRIKEIFIPNDRMRFLVSMRYASYYKNGGGKLLYYKWLIKYKRISVKMGYTIGVDVFGYGLVIPHRGTIIVGGNNHIGNYAVLHTSTCIVNSGSTIGDALYLSTGAIISGHVELGNNVSIAANSTVNKNCQQDNVLLVGTPAIIKKSSEAWYKRDAKHYFDRVEEIEKLRLSMGL